MPFSPSGIPSFSLAPLFSGKGYFEVVVEEGARGHTGSLAQAWIRRSYGLSSTSWSVSDPSVLCDLCDHDDTGREAEVDL